MKGSHEAGTIGKRRQEQPVFSQRGERKKGTDRENWEGGGGWSLVAKGKLWLGGGDTVCVCVPAPSKVKDSGKSEGEGGDMGGETCLS